MVGSLGVYCGGGGGAFFGGGGGGTFFPGGGGGGGALPGGGGAEGGGEGRSFASVGGFVVVGVGGADFLGGGGGGAFFAGGGGGGGGGLSAPPDGSLEPWIDAVLGLLVLFAVNGAMSSPGDAKSVAGLVLAAIGVLVNAGGCVRTGAPYLSSASTGTVGSGFCGAALVKFEFC